jgi:hypothetical protein
MAIKKRKILVVLIFLFKNYKKAVVRLLQKYQKKKKLFQKQENAK